MQHTVTTLVVEGTFGFTIVVLDSHRRHAVLITEVHSAPKDALHQCCEIVSVGVANIEYVHQNP